MLLKRKFAAYKARAIALRREGRTYGDIQNDLGIEISKSTLCLWLRDIDLSKVEHERLARRVEPKLRASRKQAWAVSRFKRSEYLRKIQNRVKHLPKLLVDGDVAKIALAMLYWCEGGKTGGSVVFCNADFLMIKTFLSLFRKCYEIDEHKIRCTVQCRADQDVQSLKRYWSEVTEISLEKFCPTQIDPRTVGKPTLMMSYQGVLRIDYYCADIYNEIKEIYTLVGKGL